jgi:hypothetical protein
MMGWMLIFALMFLCGAMVVVEGVGRAPGMTSSLVFGFLLAVTALTRVLRGRA